MTGCVFHDNCDDCSFPDCVIGQQGKPNWNEIRKHRIIELDKKGYSVHGIAVLLKLKNRTIQRTLSEEYKEAA